MRTDRPMGGSRKERAGWALALVGAAVSILGWGCGTASAQSLHDLMAHTPVAVYAARLDTQQSGNPAGTAANGTAVVVVDFSSNTGTFDVTYSGLPASATRVALHNFGRGSDGPEVRALCPTAGLECPSGPFGTIRGELTELPSDLVDELTLGRIYVEVSVAGDGSVRGQFDNRELMIHSDKFLARINGDEGDPQFSATGILIVAPDVPSGSARLNYLLTVSNEMPVEIGISPNGSSVATTSTLSGAGDQPAANTVSGSIALPADALSGFTRPAGDAGKPWLAIQTDQRVVRTPLLQVE